MSEKLYGIYDANAGIFGKLAYASGRLTKNKHCYLCDITHNLAWKKSESTEFTQGFDIPIKLLHINEQSEEMHNLTLGKTPCVIIEDGGGFREIINRHTLRSCKGDVEAFREVLSQHLLQLDAR